MAKISEKEAKQYLCNGPITIGDIAKDISNQKFNWVIPIIPIGRNTSKKILWLCKCTRCNNYMIAHTSNIVQGLTKSCGCFHDYRAGLANKDNKKRERQSKTKSIPKQNRSFIDLYPEIAKTWDYNKNKKQPSEINGQTHKKYWFVCKKCEQSYLTSPHELAIGRGCGVCSGHQIVIGYNDLAHKYPEMIIEFSKNNIFNPTDITYGSGKKIEWICKTCGYGKNGEWTTTINDKIRYACPRCRASKYEKIIIDWLLKNKIIFRFNRRYPNKDNQKLLKTAKFKPDFLLEEHNIWIEYDSELHFSPQSAWGERKNTKHTFLDRIKRDKLKRKFAEGNGWRFIVIPYTESAKIEEILNTAIFHPEQPLDIKIPEIQYV